MTRELEFTREPVRRILLRWRYEDDYSLDDAIRDLRPVFAVESARRARFEGVEAIDGAGATRPG